MENIPLTKETGIMPYFGSQETITKPAKGLKPSGLLTALMKRTK